MRVSSVTAAWLLASIAAELLGCNGDQRASQAVPIAAATVRGVAEHLASNPRRRLSVTERVVYSFDGAAGDGFAPVGGLLAVDGTYYGATDFGGPPSGGHGTVYKITRSGGESVLHSFDGTDGGVPGGNLINVNGTLYGETSVGGTYDDGTVYGITPSGELTTVHNFAGYPDGQEPMGALTNLNGTMYGTTWEGGTYNQIYGTVYSVTTTGNETVLYSFLGAPGDGANPGADVINIKGTLYGTTVHGGAYNDGTVFSVTTSGTEKVLHSFSDSPDGSLPAGGLTIVNGAIYGTTPEGGTGTGCPSYGCGTVFTVDASGNEKVLYSFAGSPDGEVPQGNLLNVAGTLYGTTERGGAYGDGTVFTITTSGQEAVLYSFMGRPDGKGPNGGLIDVKGTLLGTTTFGGRYDTCRGYPGCGTIFEVTP